MRRCPRRPTGAPLRAGTGLGDFNFVLHFSMPEARAGRAVDLPGARPRRAAQSRRARRVLSWRGTILEGHPPGAHLPGGAPFWRGTLLEGTLLEGTGGATKPRRAGQSPPGGYPPGGSPSWRVTSWRMPSWQNASWSVPFEGATKKTECTFSLTFKRPRSQERQEQTQHIEESSGARLSYRFVGSRARK